MTEKPNDYLLKGIARGEDSVLQYIYDNFFPRIQRYITNNNGSTTDAKDIFQDSVFVIYQKSQNPDFKITCSFGAFLFLICKRKWLNHLRDNRKERYIEADSKSLDRYEKMAIQDVMELEEYEVKNKLFKSAFEILGKKCKDLIREVLTGNNLKSIAAKMGWTYGYVRRRKSECVGQMVAHVKQSPLYAQLNQIHER